MIKVKLNNAEFNYDVYQMINLFFLFPDIKFVEENYDFNIEVKENTVIIQKGLESFEYTINKLYKLKEEVKKAVFLYFSKDTKIGRGHV